MNIVSKLKPTRGISVGMSSAENRFEHDLAFGKLHADLCVAVHLGDTMPVEQVFDSERRLDLEFGQTEEEAGVAILCRSRSRRDRQNQHRRYDYKRASLHHSYSPLLSTAQPIVFPMLP